MFNRRIFLCILLPVCLSFTAISEENVRDTGGDRLYLTWQRDPTTTMTVVCLHQTGVLPAVEGSRGKSNAIDLPHVGDVALDGAAADWWERGLSVNFLPDREKRLPDPDSLRAELRTGWNGRGLLVAARIRDDDRVEAEKVEDLWMADSLEIFVSDGVGSPRRYQLLASAGADPAYGEPRSHLLQRTADNEPRQENLTATVKSVVEGHAYTMEILLPWENLPSVSPEKGAELGLQIYVNDLDGKVSKRYTWNSADDTHMNVHSMERVSLSQKAGEPIVAQATVRKDGEGLVLKVSALAEAAGETVRAMVGEEVLGEGKLEADGPSSHLWLKLPRPPAGRSWGMVDVLIGGRYVSSVPAPAEYEPPDRDRMKLRYWEADVSEETGTEVEMDFREVAFWGGKFLKHVELKGLKPGTAYRFRLEKDPLDYGFRTLPAALPLRLAFGGDTRHQQDWMEQMNRVAMEQKPQAVIWGGDLAYANGMESNVPYWQEWFDAVHYTLRDDERYLVPLVVTIGNHEVQKGYHSLHPEYEQTDAWRARIAPYYYQLFPFPGQPGYGVLNAGDYLSLVLLDSAHTNPIPGEQTEWLRKTLEMGQRMKHVIPIYHMPAYPSVRAFNGAYSAEVRKHWLPLFEEFGVRLGFEHHDHAYKRTFPIRDGKVNEDGIVFVGDGAWGVGIREVHPQETTWYLERAQSVRHSVIVDLHDTGYDARVLSSDGEIIDQFSFPPKAEAGSAHRPLRPPRSAGNPSLHGRLSREGYSPTVEE